MRRISTSIGSVSSVNPARRELRIALRSGAGSRIGGKDWIGVVFPGGKEIQCRTAGVRVSGDQAIIQLAAGVTRDNVAHMKGCDVVVPEEKVSRADKELVNTRDLMDFKVQTSAGEVIGTIAGVLETGANDVIEIEKPSGGSILLPVIDEVIKDIRWEDAAVVVSNIERHGVDHDDTALA